MTPKQHKAEAERVLRLAGDQGKRLQDAIMTPDGIGVNDALVILQGTANMLAAAQVHATLATAPRWPDEVES